MSEKDSRSKSHLLRKSPSVQQLREEIRKQFHTKLKTAREKIVGKRRELYTCIVSDVQQHFAEIDDKLLEGDSESNILSSDEIIRVSIEVEKELYQTISQQQVDEYVHHQNDFINYLLEKFVTVCNICNKFVETDSNANVICGDCFKVHFNSDNF